MTEPDKLIRAKACIDRLADGLDPVTGAPLPTTDAVQNPQVSRCLRYVSELLAGDLAAETRAAASSASRKKREKLPFSMDLAAREAFAFFAEPATLSQFVRAVNEAACAENMRPLASADVAAWLEESGFLMARPSDDGRTVRRPTAAGQSLGIGVEARRGERGMYAVVTYDADAQRFLLDNLDAVAERRARLTKREDAPWSEREDAYLLTRQREGASNQEIAAAVRRSPSAVRARLRTLGKR